MSCHENIHSYLATVNLFCQQPLEELCGVLSDDRGVTINGALIQPSRSYTTRVTPFALSVLGSS